jgi:hypothetical protein
LSAGVSPPAVRMPIRFMQSSISLLKNAVVAFFNLAKRRAKLSAKAQNNYSRRHFGITSM